MVDDRLIEVGRPSPRFMRKHGLSWFSEGENEDYFAPEILSVTEAQVEHFRTQAASLYELAWRAARHVRERQLWAAAGIPDNAVELVEYSLREEAGLHLAGRFDFAGGLGRAPLKLLEFNADTFSLAPETATVMPHQLELLPRRQRKGARQYNNLLSGLAHSFRRILNHHPNRHPSLLLSGMGHEEDWLNLELIAMAARQAGFRDVELMVLEKVIFSEDDGIFIEPGPGEYQQFDFWFKMVPWDFIAFEEPELMGLLTRIVTKDLAVVLNPASTMLLQSKALLPFMQELAPTHPALLRSGRSPEELPGTGSYVAKPIFGRTGNNVSIFRHGKAVQSNEGDYGNFPMLYQELARFDQDVDGDCYQPSIFTAGAEPCALCLRRQDGLIVDDDAEFVGHVIEGKER
ncbi:MAG: glutathionylspermidine synthase family protein [Phaeodactylibacter sp.]|nr:glutathionylspermidine synthase family protein [Phaeodactylibacter sp.]